MKKKSKNITYNLYMNRQHNKTVLTVIFNLKM